jgi:hypothetical protein
MDEIHSGRVGIIHNRQIWRSSEVVKSWKSFKIHLFIGFHTCSEKEVELLNFQSPESNLDRKYMKHMCQQIHVSKRLTLWKEGGIAAEVRKNFVSLKSRGDIDHCLQQTRGRISYLLRFFSLRFLKYVCQQVATSRSPGVRENRGNKCSTPMKL